MKRSVCIRWLPACLLLAGCATGVERPRIGDLDIADLTPQAEPAIDFSISRQQVIDSYRELADMSPDQPPFGRIRQRLADLELEASLDNRLSSEVSEAETGATEARNAVQRYLDYLDKYPQREDNDKILYQLSRAFAIDNDFARARQFMDRLVRDFPNSAYLDEIQFRRAELFFVEGRYSEAASAYAAVTAIGESSLFYDKALYKLGWSQFKKLEFDPALTSFMQLLDLQQRGHRIGPEGLAQNLGRADQEFIEDILRVVSLAFSYSSHARPIERFFASAGSRVYEPLLYQRLANYYQTKDRVTDATATLLDFARPHPESPYTARFHDQAIAIYRDADFADLVLKEKIDFVEKFNVGSVYWMQQSPNDRVGLQVLLTRHLGDLATHFHAAARSSSSARAYDRATDWYRKYLDSFPTDERAPEMNFLLAECLLEAGHPRLAITEYANTAYAYPEHARSAEAGYAVLTAYDRTLKGLTDASQKTALLQARADHALQFSEQFADDQRVPDVILNTSEHYYQQKDYPRARELAERLTSDTRTRQPARIKALTIIAYSHFELKQFEQAESAYQALLPQLPEGDTAKRRQITEQLASSVYMRAAALRDSGQSAAAAMQFERISNIAPESTINQAASYDAATEYIKLEDWPTAIKALERFRTRYPQAPDYRKGISEKLALAYLKTGEHNKAAGEILVIMRLSASDEQPALLWQAATLYEQGSDESRAIELYQDYIKKHPRPVERAIETQHKIASYYQRQKETKPHRYWLQQIIKTDANAGDERSDRSRLLAARASLELVRPTHRQFSELRLTRPLKASLQRKKQLMQESINAYTKAARYQIEEITTLATFNIGEIYREFARSLLKSEKPKGLNDEELEEYTFLLEDQAFPFEEKAITIHESNLARIANGSYDESIRNSLNSLSEMMPFRYAKNEVIDIYVD